MAEIDVDIHKLVETFPVALSCSVCSEHLYTFEGGVEGVGRDWFPEAEAAVPDLPTGGGVPKGRYILQEKDTQNFVSAVEGKNNPGFGSPLACIATDHCPGYADLAPLERARRLLDSNNVEKEG